MDQDLCDNNDAWWPDKSDSGMESCGQCYSVLNPSFDLYIQNTSIDLTLKTQVKWRSYTTPGGAIKSDNMDDSGQLINSGDFNS